MFAATGQENEYRANFHGKEPGIPVGLTHEGKLLIGESKSELQLNNQQMQDIVLRMRAECIGNIAQINLQAFAPGNLDEPIAQMSESIEKTPLAGNLTLVCHGKITNWFADWKISGDKVDAHPQRKFGPILWTQYTLHAGILKLTAFFPPLDAQKDTQTAVLEFQRNGKWNPAAQSQINPNGKPGEWNGKTLPYCTFRIEKWDDSENTPFRIVYNFLTPNGEKQDTYQGTIRRNPTDKTTIKLSAVTGMGNMVFPNHHMQDNLLAHDPDVAFFSGDNVYGQNYCYFGWSFRELLRDRPSICTPDDHDVGENDLWGREENFDPKANHDSGAATNYLPRLSTKCTTFKPRTYPTPSTPTPEKTTSWFTSQT